MSNNLVFGVWSNGHLRVYSGTECIYEGTVFRELVNENSICSNCKLSSHTYRMDTFEGALQKHIYVALSVLVDKSKTLLKVFKLNFSDIRANRMNDEHTYNFRNDCNLEVSNLLHLCEHSHKSIIDLQLEADALWCLSSEDTNFNKPSTGLFKSANYDTSALPSRSSIERYDIKRNLTPESHIEKCLKNAVWALDDQLLLEKVEDNESIHPAVMTNQVIEGRILRRYGGSYLKDIPIQVTKHSSDFKK